MRFFILGFRLILLLLMSAFLMGKYSFAQTASPPKISAALICGPFSGNPPQTPAFADKIAFDFSNDALTGVRQTRVQKGSETYKGNVDPSGKIKISGAGQFENRSSQWSSEYLGQLQEKRPTVLQGTLRVKGALAGIHRCMITFLLAPADLKKALSPNEAAAQPRPQ
jgi:hypothetical protein